MADSDQNEPGNDKPESNKKDQNELSGWNLADFLIGETAAHQQNASSTERKPGSLFEPRGEAEVSAQNAVHAETSSPFEPNAGKQTQSTYPVYTEPSSQPETSSLLEPSAETETPPQEAVHTETSSLPEPSAETGAQPQEAVHAETSAADTNLAEISSAETGSRFELSGEKQTQSTYPVYTEPSSQPETSSLPEPSAEMGAQQQEAVHAETSSVEASSLFDLSGEKQTQSTYPVYTEPSSQPETSSLPEPSAETGAQQQEAVRAETSSAEASSAEPSAAFELSGEKQTQPTYPVYAEPSLQAEASSLPEPSATGTQEQEAVHAETGSAETGSAEASAPFEQSGEVQTHSTYPVYTEPSSQQETSSLPEPSAETAIHPQDTVHTEGGTPIYVSAEAENHEQSSAGRDAETGRHEEPAEKTAAYEPRAEAAKPDGKETEPPIAKPEVIPPVEPAGPEKRRTNVAFLFAAAAIAVLVVTAGIFIAIYWQQLNSVPTADSAQAAQPATPTDARDLGTMDSSAAGLKGHLTTKWNDGLGYSFVIEPDDPARQAAFAMTVSNPPRAASISIQIRNSDGEVLCTQDVLLRFDPRKVAALERAEEKPARGPHGVKTSAAIPEGQDARLDRQVAAEAEREHDKSIFQVNAGQNGKIESISSQGEIPCPQSVYEGMGYWSFLPDFPSPGEQAAWLNKASHVQAKVETTEATASETNRSEANKSEAKTPAPQPATHQRMIYKAADVPGAFSIAGDDAIVEYDAGAGNIGTKAGKVFSIDKAGAEAHAIQGYDLPFTIHYRCDQYAACTITHGGAVIARAKLSQ